MYVVIIGIPLTLAYEFGIYFLAYLRGVGSLPVFSYEFLFDIIGVIIFFTRIIVQGVRLVLMLFAIGSIQEFILLNPIHDKNFICPEVF
jgi:hypothetical protein